MNFLINMKISAVNNDFCSQLTSDINRILNRQRLKTTLHLINFELKYYFLSN